MTAIWKPFAAGLSLFALAACGGGEDAAPGGDAAANIDPALLEIVETRHETMEEIGDSFKTIRDELKAGDPDLEAIQTAAAYIEEQSTKVGDWFPDGTSPADGVDTDALASIWERPDDFDAAVAQFETAAASLNAAAQSGDMSALGGAVQETGGACKNCHDDFRADDD